MCAKAFKLLYLFGGLCLLLGGLSWSAIAQDAPPVPFDQVKGDTITLSRYFAVLKQGRVGLIRVDGDITNTLPTGTFLDRTLNFFTIPTESGVFALITAPLTQAQRDYPLTVQANNETLTMPISIMSGEFIQQQVLIFGETSNLINREIEDAELAQLFALAETLTLTPFWQLEGFNHPINAELTSPFGAVRTFNGFYETLHTGWDYQAPTGKPMVASSSGIVAFAGRLPIRGNYVLIDHGYGVFSGYAHLSIAHVVQGQSVRAGQIIGQVGSTGRSSSAHAHIEFIINEQWIDSRDFLQMYLPK